MAWATRSRSGERFYRWFDSSAPTVAARLGLAGLGLAWRGMDVGVRLLNAQPSSLQWVDREHNPAAALSARLVPRGRAGDRDTWAVWRAG